MGFRSGLFKLKRSLNNLAFRMSFVKLAPGSSRPLLPVASFLILAFTIFVLSGGLFVAVGAGTPISLLNVAQGLSFIYPHDINNQTPAEGVFVGLLYVFGVVGLYMLFMSTRNAYRPKRAYSFLGFGMLLSFVFMITAYFVLYQKLM
jgi:hypothetical protein